MAIEISLLEEHDILLPSDFYRYTEVRYDGQSDDFSETNIYGGSAINFFRWMRLDREHGCAGWYGKTVGEVVNLKSMQPHPCYEFARGNIPERLQVPETLLEEQIRLGETVLPIGKYKGLTVNDVLQIDDGYIRWLYYNTKTFSEFSSFAVSAYI